eukprot:jgi/Chrzof1/12288/Cz06g28230.t1
MCILYTPVGWCYTGALEQRAAQAEARLAAIEAKLSAGDRLGRWVIHFLQFQKQGIRKLGHVHPVFCQAVVTVLCTHMSCACAVIQAPPVPPFQAHMLMTCMNLDACCCKQKKRLSNGRLSESR